ncbi:MAG TPA: HepT-like ribonuclease domain-containing protein [Stellaceae bacterium]|jgi:uncharacterized protein with HEPN domain
MTVPSALPRLADIIDAIEHIRSVTAGLSLDEFEADWQKRWLVERGVEIISEASRRLSPDLKARHADIPWPKVAGIGNILRHEYERIAADILWKLVQDDLVPLDRVCRLELAALGNSSDRAP